MQPISNPDPSLSPSYLQFTEEMHDPSIDAKNTVQFVKIEMIKVLKQYILLEIPLFFWHYVFGLMVLFTPKF